MSKQGAPKRGEIGYIDGVKRKSIKVGLSGLLLILLLIICGFFTSGDYRSPVAGFAGLVAIPTALYLSRYFGYRRYKSTLSKETFEDSVFESMTILYEVIFLRGEKAYYIDGVVISDGAVLLLLSKDLKGSSDSKRLRQEMETMILKKGIVATVTIFESIQTLKEYVEKNDTINKAKNEMDQSDIMNAILGSTM